MNAQIRKNRQKRTEVAPADRETRTTPPTPRVGFTCQDVEFEALERLARKGFDWDELLANRLDRTHQAGDAERAEELVLAACA